MTDAAARVPRSDAERADMLASVEGLVIAKVRRSGVPRPLREDA